MPDAGTVPASAPRAAFPFAYRREWFGADVVSGLTAAAVVIPQAMAYAVIAGLPLQTGLYTSLATMLVYPFLGTSRPLSVTTTSPMAMMTAAQTAAIASGGSAVSAASVAATLAFVVGAALFAAWILRLGFVANFISKPVLVGFKCGVGVAIFVGQMKAVLGVHVESRTTLGALMELPGKLSETHGPTALVALAGLAFLLTLPRVAPRFPAPLAWVAIGIVAARWFGLADRGVALVGAVPPGLPSVALPDLSLASVVWPAALGIALMSFTETMAAARAFRGPEDPPLDANRELVAVGAAGVASSFVGGMPAGGGTSQTAVTDKAGAKSQAAQIVGAAAVLATLLLLSRVIGGLPKAALGALIVAVAISMIKPAAFGAIARVRRMELAWALATLAGVVLVGTLDGILVAVAISFLTLVYQANHPPVYAVAWNRAKNVFRRAGESPDDETIPGLLILRTEGRLTFMNTERAFDQMRELIAHSNARVVVLECSAIPDIEYTALEMLAEGERKLREHGVTLWLSTLNPAVADVIRRTPLGATLGAGRVFPNLRIAVDAFLARTDTQRGAT
jgi:high affinity sulfate transporter 1